MTQAIRLSAVALIIGAMILIREIGSQASSDARGTALALGFSLIVAVVAGEFLRRFRMPRLTGYLLFGLLIGPYFGNVITEGLAQQLATLNAIATTLIAFIAGLTLNVERLERRVAGAGTATAVTLAVAMTGLGLGLWLLWG
jgi:Kef-type K+ transport system membrane component KefB